MMMVTFIGVYDYKRTFLADHATLVAMLPMMST